MLRDFSRYFKIVVMRFWLGTFGFIMAVPEILRLFVPNSFAARASALLDGHVPSGRVAAVTPWLAIVGLLSAGFFAWREADHEIGLRAQIKQVHYMPLGRQTRIFVVVELFNSGARSVASDWRLSMGRKIAPSSERNFQSDSERFDPQTKPIEQGARAFGSLLFQTDWPTEEIKRKQRRLRLTFRDAARRMLSVEDERWPDTVCE
jgi:hypothetical protein